MIPSELSITEYAALAGVSRRVIERRVEGGFIKTVRRGKRKRVIPLAEVRRLLADDWESIIERLRLMRYGSEI